jgi:hypothetical protein
MKVTKEAGISAGCTVDEKELALINVWSKRELKAEEVYAFSVRLCDNEVDRDYERFLVATLTQLGELFVGKSGIFDHQWSAMGQTARIYRTELISGEGAPTAAGEVYTYLKGYAYMLRSEKNQELIDEIEAGIKREVSVGCAVAQMTCSLCGMDRKSGSCGHEPGLQYDGTLCWTELSEATDAYEWSFVAVPAQRNAGVMKQMGASEERQKQLEAEAALGRRYLAGLRKEVTRLGGLAEPGLDMGTLKTISEKLEEEELLKLKQAYESRLEGKKPKESQLFYGEPSVNGTKSDGAFLI